MAVLCFNYIYTSTCSTPYIYIIQLHKLQYVNCHWKEKKETYIQFCFFHAWHLLGAAYKNMDQSDS